MARKLLNTGRSSGQKAKRGVAIGLLSTLGVAGLAACGDNGPGETLTSDVTATDATPNVDEPTFDPSAEYSVYQHPIELEPDLNLDSPNYNPDSLVSTNNSLTIGEIHYLSSILSSEEGVWNTQDIMDALVQASDEEIARIREVLASLDENDDPEVSDVLGRYGLDTQGRIPYDLEMPIGEINDMTRAEFQALHSIMTRLDYTQLRNELAQLTGKDLEIARDVIAGTTSRTELITILEHRGLEWD